MFPKLQPSSDTKISVRLQDISQQQEDDPRPSSLFPGVFQSQVVLYKSLTLYIIDVVQINKKKSITWHEIDFTIIPRGS